MNVARNRPKFNSLVESRKEITCLPKAASMAPAPTIGGAAAGAGAGWSEAETARARAEEAAKAAVEADAAATQFYAGGQYSSEW